MTNKDNEINYEFNPYNDKRTTFPIGDNPYKEIDHFKKERSKLGYQKPHEKKDKP
jgi:hypothetical protein